MKVAFKGMKIASSQFYRLFKAAVMDETAKNRYAAQAL
jgi:hypothetical protein